MSAIHPVTVVVVGCLAIGAGCLIVAYAVVVGAVNLVRRLRQSYRDRQHRRLRLERGLR